MARTQVSQAPIIVESGAKRVDVSQAPIIVESGAKRVEVSQAPIIVEMQADEARLSQLLVIVEVDQVGIHLSQIMTLVEVEYVPPVKAGPADYAGPGSAAAANAQGSAATTTPSATTPQSATGSAGGANAGGSAATTTPATVSPQTATGAASANARSSAATTTPKAAAPRTAMAAAAGIQVPDTGPSIQSSQGAAAPLPTAITGASTADGRFSAELYDRAGLRVLPPDLTLRPLQYSAKAVGGPDQAALWVEGVFPALWTPLNWLAYSLRIVNPLGRVVWEGIIEEVSITLPALRVGLSIRDLFNRVQVQYTRTLDADAATESLITTWAEDAASIARYGTKELKASLNDGSMAQAEALRDTILESSYKPLQTVSVGSGGAPGAELRCIGRWLTLDWQYYANDAGYVTFEPEQTTEQAIGYAYTGTGIGFKDDGIHDIDMGLSTLPEQGLLVVAGSPANAGTVTVDGAPGTVIADQVTRTATDISFDPEDDVIFSMPQLFTVAEMVEIAGSTSNDGFYWIKRIIDGARFEVTIGGIVHEAVGASVTITQGHHATVADGAFVLETPGASVTLSSHAGVAQKFTAPATWDAQDIVLLLSRIGTPVDHLVVGLYSETAGVPGTLLGSVALDAVDVPVGLDWTECRLAAPVTLTSGTDYWVVVTRDGAASATNYWAVGVSDELLSTFVAKLYTGAAWIDHPASVDMALQVWATVDSAVKAGAVAAGAAYVTRTAVIEATGVRVRTFSDGTRRRSEEMQALLDAGDTASARLLAWFDATGALNIGVQEADDGTLAIQQDGRLTMLPAQEWEAGALPVRRWVRIMDLPPGEVFGEMSPFYVEAATYDTGAMALAIEPLANQAVWEGGG